MAYENYSELTESEQIDILLPIVKEMGYDDEMIADKNSELGESTKSIEGIESILRQGIDENATHRSDFGNDRLQIITRDIDRFDIPDTLVMDLLQNERDIANSSGFPTAIAKQLAIEQEIDGRGLEDTYSQRMKLWDELLAFTQYRVTVHIDGERVRRETLVKKSEAKARNKVVESIPTDERVENDINVEVEILGNFDPELDPLPDCEDFVYRY